MSDHELPMLAGIGGIIHWCEELASLLAGPVLTAGLGIALIDLLTDGKLLATTPALLFAWAVSQTVGLDAQLVGSAAKLGAALRRRTAGPVIGYGLLVLALGYVAFQASNVFATQQAEGITTAQALARLGMDGATWIVERSALAVVLVVLSGLLRYASPAPNPTSVEDERATLERELTLEPLRQRLRAQQVGGIRMLAESAMRGTSANAITTATTTSQSGEGSRTREPNGENAPASPPIPAPNVFRAAASAVDEIREPLLATAAGFETDERSRTATPEGAQGRLSTNDAPTSPAMNGVAVVVASGDRDDRPPTGGGSPTLASKPRVGNVTPLRRGLGRSPKRDRKTTARANARSGYRGNAEARVRAALASKPTLTDEKLMRVADVSSSTVSKWRRVIEAEQQAAEASAQRAQ